MRHAAPSERILSCVVACAGCVFGKAALKAACTGAAGCCRQLPKPHMCVNGGCKLPDKARELYCKVCGCHSSLLASCHVVGDAQYSAQPTTTQPLCALLCWSDHPLINCPAASAAANLAQAVLHWVRHAGRTMLSAALEHAPAVFALYRFYVDPNLTSVTS